MYNVNMRRSREEIQKQQKKKDVFKVLGVVAFLTLILLMGISVYQHILTMNQKLVILEKIEKEVDQLRVHNLKLIFKKNEAVSYEYIEKEARDKLGYSDEDEILFVIPDKLLESREVEEKLIMAKGEDIDDGYMEGGEIFEQWVEFLFVEGV